MTTEGNPNAPNPAKPLDARLDRRVAASFNKVRPGNGAQTLLFHTGRLGRSVPDLRR